MFNIMCDMELWNPCVIIMVEPVQPVKHCLPSYVSLYQQILWLYQILINTTPTF